MRNPQVDPRQQRALAGAAALALLLGGCAHLPARAAASGPSPTPATHVACVQASQIPPEPPTVGTRFNGDARHDLQVLAPNAKALRDWGQAMHAMLEACAGAAPAPSADGKSPSPAGRG